MITVGAAGAIDPKLKIGDLVLIDKALRDEGTSHHYLPTEDFSCADKSLMEKILKIQNLPVKAAWTLDAPYRETKEEIKHYQSHGISCVDMEAAAVFSFAEYHKIKAAALFCISDLLYLESWQPHFGHADVKVGIDALTALAVQTLI